MLQLLDDPFVAPPGLVGDYWYENQAPGIIINNVAAPTGADAIPLYVDFNVSIQGQNVSVYRMDMAVDGTGYPGGGVANQQPVGIADFDVNGAVTATVTVSNRTVTSCAVFPRRHGVTPTRVGNVITVPIPHPGKYILQINGSQKNFLCLFANPPEIIPTGTLITYGPGIHHPGRVALAANTTVWVQRGAVVYGSFSAMGNNSRITGRGFLSKRLEPNSSSTHMLQIGGSNVSVNGVYLVYGQPFVIRPTNCSGLVVDNVKEFSARDNSDGCSITSSTNTTIRNSFFANWDDGQTCKTDPGPAVDGVTVIDNLYMTASGWRLFGYGAEGGAEFRNAVYRRNDALWTHCMNLLHTETPNNPFIHDILVEDLVIDDHHGHQQTGLHPTSRFFYLGNDGGSARHANITFRNIRGYGIRPPSALNGNCNGIHFEDIYWNDVKISTSDAAMGLTRNGGPIVNVTYS